jgi:hypothetical protein
LRGAIERYKRTLCRSGFRPLPELFGPAGLAFDFSPDTMTSLMDEIRQEREALPL